ncbi:MAG: outer membrane beta-barrel protein, partial [Bacteroidota bacterium]
FGIQSAGILFGKVGPFLEYKLAPAIGIQTALMYSWDTYFAFKVKEAKNKDALITIQSIALPVIMRWYPGRDRQLCLSLGLHSAYLLGATMYLGDTDFSFSFINAKEAEKHFKQNVKQKYGNKARSIDMKITAGLDYEFTSGFGFGFECSKRIRPVLACKSTFGTSFFQLTFKYNIAKAIG